MAEYACNITVRERGPAEHEEQTVEVKPTRFNRTLLDGMKRIPASERSTSGDPDWFWYFLPSRLEELKTLAAGCGFDAVYFTDHGGDTINLLASTPGQGSLFSDEQECPECRGLVQVKDGRYGEHFRLAPEPGKCKGSGLEVIF